MTAHELAAMLLAGPDAPIVVAGQHGGYDTPRIHGAIIRPDTKGQTFDDHYGVHVLDEETESADLACVLLVGDDFPWIVGLESHAEAVALLEELSYQRALATPTPSRDRPAALAEAGRSAERDP